MARTKILIICALCVLCGWVSSRADEIPCVQVSSIGVTAKGTPIRALLGQGDLDLKSEKTRILLVGERSHLTEPIEAAVKWFHTADEAARWRKQFTLSAVPCVYPDGGEHAPSFPPKGPSYTSNGDPEAAYLWRWIGMHGPDLVIEVLHHRGTEPTVFAIPPRAPDPLRPLLRASDRLEGSDDGLVVRLNQTAPGGTGIVPAVAAMAPQNKPFLPELLQTLAAVKFSGPSPARRELQRRLDRTPLEVAEQLAKVYGHDLGSVVYIPAAAVMGRVRLAKLTKDAAMLADAERLAQPYVAGEKPSRPNGDTAYAGHLIFAELADASEDGMRARYIALAKAAADAMLREDGSADLKRLSGSRMSDAVFMSGPILARVGRLTGEAKCIDAAAAHVANMAKIDLREDGLWRHSPLDEAAWGRGNGFPALGLAMILDELPGDHPQRGDLLQLYRRHMDALAKHQDYTGAWHQVIDREESYRELTCTCMIAYAMVRGVRQGWIDREKFEPLIDRAWHAIRTRVAADGTLVDVCTGTGKQKSLRDYFDREAILGRDARGGAMALLIATEMAARENRKRQ